MGDMDISARLSESKFLVVLFNLYSAVADSSVLVFSKRTALAWHCSHGSNGLKVSLY